jgi:hypothetical protein
MLIINIKICFKRSTISFCFDVFDTINFHSMSCSKRWLSNSSLKYFFSQSMRKWRTRLFSCSLCCWKCLKTSNVSNLTRSTYIIDRLIKSHKNVTKYLILSLNIRNWTKSLHIKFKECLSKITKLLCNAIFYLIIIHDSQKYLFIMSLIKFIFFDILTSWRTFCSFRCFNRACHTFRMFLLIAILDLFDDIAKLSTINVTMKL